MLVSWKVSQFGNLLNFIFSKYLFIYLFLWLSQVSAVACDLLTAWWGSWVAVHELSSCGVSTELPGDMKILVPRPGISPKSPAKVVWTTREVPVKLYLPQDFPNSFLTTESFFNFWPYPKACGTFPTRDRTSSCVVEAWSLNHWTITEVPWSLFFT